jgi:hypothetical protein
MPDALAAPRSAVANPDIDAGASEGARRTSRSANGDSGQSKIPVGGHFHLPFHGQLISLPWTNRAGRVGP